MLASRDPVTECKCEYECNDE